MMSIAKMAKWINLHQEMLEIIFDLCLLPEQIRMQSVCKSWRLILENPRELPWLMMLPKNNQEEDDHHHQDPDARAFFSLSKPKEDHHSDPDACAFFSLSQQKIHTIHLLEIRGKRCCGSFQNGWLMIIDKLDVFLFHPWSKKRLELPHQSIFDFKYDSHIKHLGIPSSQIMMMRGRFQIIKAALSDDCKLMVAVFYGPEMYLLAFSRIGDDAWTDIVVPQGLVNVIYHNGQFYCIAMWGGVYLVHIENDNAYAKRLTEDVKEPYGDSYLVPDMLTDTNIMFVILRERVTRANVHDTIHFHIYKFPLGEQGPLDQEKEVVKKFIKVESLGDRVIFLGYNSPIIVMASEFPVLKGNCIYFTDDYPASIANGYGDGVFLTSRMGLLNNFSQIDFILPLLPLYGLQPHLIPPFREIENQLSISLLCVPTPSAIFILVSPIVSAYNFILLIFFLKLVL